MKTKKLWAVIISVIILAALIIGGKYFLTGEIRAVQISVDEAQSIVNSEFDKMASTPVMKYIAKENYITVNEMYYGDEKDIILDCTVSTLDVHKAVSPEYNTFLSSDERKSNGTMFKSALDFKLEFQDAVMELVKSADDVQYNVKIALYEVDGAPDLFSDYNSVNAVYGGVLKIKDEVEGIKTVVDASGNEVAIQSGNVNKGLVNTFDIRCETQKPDTSSAVGRVWNSLKYDFHKNFIDHGRWKTILTGLWVTIKLTVCALLIGIVLGFMVAFVRCTYIKNPKKGILIRILNKISGIYLTITRGTPVVVQIMIIYFVIFMPMGVDKFLAAVICFGLNSGAYVAEIVRGGIMSIDDGQSEAGRSLGFGYMATMWHIVFPQAFKAVLPALANEFVVLLKETSIAFYIGLGDLMYAGNAIRAATYSAFMPLVAVAVIYLIMVLALSKFVSILERRLRNSER